ncbi:MAG: hypothetical protein K6G80_03960 [Treponema sp.]|nr:hypothetical protein [Treponema sp.]
MTMTLRRFFFLACLFFTAHAAFADFLTSEKYGYTIDFPEGFTVLDGEEDGSSALLEHQFVKANVMLKVWDTDTYKDAKAALTGTFSKLGAEGTIETLRWRNQTCALSQFTMQNAAVQGVQSGWAAAYPLPLKKSILVLLVYSEQKSAWHVEQFILSTLDSVMIDRGSFRECGLITQAAFNSSEKKALTVEIAGKRIKSHIGAEDAQASQFVIDREFAVFKLYVNSKYWKEAWQRFYRQIARDTFGRTKKLAFDISEALQAEARVKDKENPDAAIAQMLLTWTQGFPYARQSASPDKADFANIPSVLLGEPSDCDSRSLLLAVLLKHMNIDACFFISSAYSHAIAGAALLGKAGQTISADGTEYLVGETTAAKGTTLGMMDAAMQDRSKWIPVILP